MMIPCLAQPERPVRTTRKIHDILQDSGIAASDELLQITVDGVTIATNAEVLDLWLRRTEWLYSQSDLQHYMKDGTELPGGYVFSEWQLFCARNGENLKRMLDALFSEYNPIDNYNMKESSSDGEKQDGQKVTPKGVIKVETTPFQTGINSVNDGAQTGKTTTETSYTNASSDTTYDNTKTMENNDGDTLTGYHHVTEHFLKRSGNIGVTTSAQMIGQELELRVVDLLDEFVSRFFKLYCYYVG